MPSPERVRWAGFRSAVVAVVALSILSVLVYLLTGGTWLQPKAYLTTYIPDSTGLAPGADVQLNGVQIGTVEWLRLTRSRDPNRVVLVQLKIEAAYLPYIPDDSVTSLDSSNLLGDEYLSITMGHSPRHIPGGGELHFRPPTNMMQNIDLEQFEAQLRIIDRTIIDIQEGRGPLGQFVVSDVLYGQFLDGVANIEKRMRAATTSQTQLGQMLYSSSLYDGLSSQVRQLDDRLAELQSNPILRDTRQYDQIRDQLAKLHQALADINAGKGAGQWIASDSTWIAWNRLLAAWIADIDALNEGEAGGGILANSQTYDSLNGALHEIAATTKEFRQNPQKFLRLKIF